MLFMDVERVDSSFDAVSSSVRQHCALKLGEVIDALTPYVDGSMGDIAAGHVAVYVSAVKELGRLYQVQSRPRDADTRQLVPVEQVELLVQAAVAEAVAATEERVRIEVAAAASASAVVAAAEARRRVAAALERVR